MENATYIPPTLEDRLAADFPDFFNHDEEGHPWCTCGFGCENGWEQLLRDLMTKLKECGARLKIAQVKEKFGGLRFDFNLAEGTTDAEAHKLFKLVQQAENDSYRICECCGTREGVTVEGAWVKTLCKPCRAEYHNERVRMVVASDPE